MIEVENLTKRDEEKLAVDGLDFVQPGIAGRDESTARRDRVDDRDYTPASLADKVRVPELSRQPKHEAVASRAATAHSSSTWLRPHVNACDLHPGDLVQQCDWTLHVHEVTVSQTTVAITVTEFGFPLHYAADTRVQLVARRAEQGASDPPGTRPGVWTRR